MLAFRLLCSLQIAFLAINWTAAVKIYEIYVDPTNDILPSTTSTTSTTTTTTTTSTTTTSTPRPIPTLPPGYIRFWDIQTSYKISSYRTNWQTAEEACRFEGARLAVIDTWPKLNYVASMRPFLNWVWTGIYKDTYGFNWKGVHGGWLTNSLPWAPLPGIFGDCVAVSGIVNGLSRWPCWKSKLYVCEIPDTV